MKKILTLLPLLLIALLSVAQTAPTDKSERLKWVLNSFHQRDFSQKELNYPLVSTPKGGNAPKGVLQLPDNNWFPGEWEEVKAVVVTCYYDYLVPGHENDNSWYADPVVSGYADYYRSGYPTGGGPYIAVPATNDMLYGDFVNVFFYLMDAIQQGGAEAWVRIENAEDSTIIKNKLLSMNLRTDNLKWLIGTGNSFWFRDCGPICFYYGDEDSLGMVDFGYYAGRALDDSLPALIEQQMNIPNYITMVKWEGGNCLVDGAGMVLSSDAIYSGNSSTQGQYTWDGSNPQSISVSFKPSLSKQQVRDSLANILGPRATYILPAFKYDGGTGHVDLYADMIDENQFVFSQMPDNYSNWTDYKTGKKNMDSLCSYESYFGYNYKADYIPFPKTDMGTKFSSQSQYNSNYTRTYSNHTFVNNLIVQPCFSTVDTDGMPTAAWDRANIEQLKQAYPGYTIYCIDVRTFDGSGGAIHCITKQIPADSPIRILHPSITNYRAVNPNAEGIPFRAIITNNKGISAARLYYHVDSSDWDSISFIPGADSSYKVMLPIDVFNGNDSITVEYYISATNTEGKTITKPMTAAQGGYFTFRAVLDENAPLGIVAATADSRFGQFYPNPATDMAQMEIDLAEGEAYQVAIINAAGRTVHTSSLVAAGPIRYSVNTARLASGLYVVVFDNGTNRVSRKLIVK